MIKIRLIEVITLLYVVLFVYAAATKLLDYNKFVVQLSQSPMLTQWSVWVSWFVPAVELVLVVLLLFEHTRVIGLYGSLLLMVMFTTYIVLSSRFSEFVPCSCGGVLEGMTWNQHLAFNSFFIGLSIIGILLPKNSLLNETK